MHAKVAFFWGLFVFLVVTFSSFNGFCTKSDSTRAQMKEKSVAWNKERGGGGMATQRHDNKYIFLSISFLLPLCVAPFCRFGVVQMRHFEHILLLPDNFLFIFKCFATDGYRA